MSTRREFLKKSALATAGTMLLPGFLKSLEANPLLIPEGQKILVVIQLSGGNDGLNTIVPYNNDLYYKLRPQLALSKGSVLRASDELGFHPALAKLNELYDKGYLTVINNVGYPNPDRSHFRSMDIWHTASDSDEYLNTGWIGRYLDSSCKNCNIAHQAVEIDDMLSLALKGENIKGIAVKNPRKLYQVLHNNYFQKISKNPTDATEPSLNYLYKTLAEATSSADYIYDKSTVYKSDATYPDYAFAGQLKTVAELINSGLSTKVYYVSLSGFDTHVRQQPEHDRLLKIYAESVSAFVNDLEKNNRFQDVLVMTFSEFGRRVSQNASGGTDHGTANNLFVIGKNLKQKGFISGTPDLSRLDQGDLIHEVDFRSVYATVLNKWLDTNSSSVLSGQFKMLDFI
ncbi:MAG TPA: DUF1501 domain-containing protein [Cyclobacteriaceae bacterium]|nr:DUF1501 domain-containing protein [Cyclobacteriaceae bacterium]HMV09182.1 DUF1501 domain-containing protein [Cyclobacteriaceae bacterium]HMV90334.1 DUF1501 domain-containing protein [Cyclobacteriaceae bacterium]HMX01449.1 DUF1501 domain-containing protein [Cyclobacteriaceae bacterium]HMX50281.1 DUF1501 domain-containing protein [Cyclobacteriaceae bacterium]